MEIIKNILDLNKAINNFENFGFVPTMGGIHEGHISLIKNSQKICKKTIVSIFVNPTQFNDKSDFKKYPRDLIQDIKILKKLKVDYLFIPTEKDIYKNKNKIFKLSKNDKILCAKYRKDHFEGVLNVMNRLLKLIKVKHVFMGEKDFQQIFLIKKYLSKKYKIKIINCRTVRDKNKIALSTRNNLLNKKNYYKVFLITKFLFKIKRRIKFAKLELSGYLKLIIQILEKIYDIKIDYLELRNEKDLKNSNLRRKYRLFIAYYIDKIRLIDNF